MALCECGCGQRVGVWQGTDRSRGRIKGQPKRFIVGHNAVTLSQSMYEVRDCGYETPCWVWQRYINPDGYGRCVRGKEQLAHRVFYIERHGSIPEGLQLDHLCRNRPCVNPDHLEPVTNAENQRRGQRSKLTLELARAIRAHPGNASEAARAFGVARATIHRVRTNESWTETVAA